MIEKRTVFVLGAGASCPYGFPTARGLREEILSFFENRYIEFLAGSNDGIPRALRMDPYPDLPAARGFLERFRLSSTDSIDLFLSRNPKLATVGKMAVCLSILHAEKRCVFREEVEKREHDWYFYLFGNMTREATTKEDYGRFGDGQISFVTFNYDRSLEHFFFESLLNSFEGIDEQKAREQLNMTPVIHVYGKPAPLPWEQDNEQKGLQYGDSELATADLLDAIGNIHVVHEGRTNPELEKARMAISTAEQIFFLGFGYAKENLEALGFPGILNKAHRVYGTAMGSTSREIKDIKQHFTIGLVRSGVGDYIVSKYVQIYDQDCVQLLRECL